eukprot:460266_1
MSDNHNILPSFGHPETCQMRLIFTDWPQIFVIVGLSYLWNLSLILWTLPWNSSKFDNGMPYLGSTLSVMFESDKFGISINNWRQLGKKRIDQNIIFNIVNTLSFKFFAFIFTLNSWILFVAKITMWLTFKSSFYYAWNARGFTDFFNIEIALVTLLMISNIFFSFPILPSFQIAATKSQFITILLYLLYTEIILTFILLCIQYPLLISVLYIGACIILTGMILGMAILCLLIIVIVVGIVMFWVLNILTLCRFRKTIQLKSFAASITWLFITYFVWVSGISLSFLFTTSYFQSQLCININSNNMYQLLSAIFILISIIITIISLFILQFIFNRNDQHKYHTIPTHQQI